MSIRRRYPLWGMLSAFPVMQGLAGTADASAAQQPNIVVILADDMGYTDLGCFGAKRWTTPNLDRMASEGMKFTNFHVAQAVCSASRAALLTGCYPQRTGVLSALLPGDRGLSHQTVTMAEMLRQRGYATGMVGKWHLGDRPGELPPDRGFDDWFGLPYSSDIWPVGYDGHPATSGCPKLRFPPLPLYDGTNRVEVIGILEQQGQLIRRYTRRALEFMHCAHSSGKPFFLYFAHSLPHVPLAVSDRFKGKSGAGLYGDVMLEFDWSVGEVLSALKEMGADHNTLVVFTSDNGPWLNYGNHSGTCDGFREGKCTAFEGGKRVPCLVRWPGRIPAGTVCNRFAATLDLFPTVGKYAGAESRSDLDGVDISALFEGGPEADPRREFWYYYDRKLCGVTDGRWKLVLPHEYRSYEGFVPGKDGYPGEYGKKWTDKALYDMQRDPGERVNALKLYPEIAQQLEKIAEKARTDLGDTDSLKDGKSLTP